MDVTKKNAELAMQAEKKRKRLERNRESARECRKRKKEKKMLLRQQLAHLEADNLQLRLKLQVGHEGKQDDSSVEITSKLQAMIKSGASESDIQKTVAELQERYSDYGRDRRSAIDFHVSQLRRCLQPTQTTRAILWLMSLAPRFHDAKTGEVNMVSAAQDKELFNLWKDLLNTIKLTPEQSKLMVSYTMPPPGSTSDPFKAIKEVTDQCNSMLDRLVEIICSKNNSLDQEMSSIQSILSATQIAKFILWIDENPACMQMLEALWPHMTDAQKQRKKMQRNGSCNTNLSSLGDLSEDDLDNDSSSSERETVS